MTRRPAGELESAVLAALWAAGTPLTPPQVQQALGGTLARTTIATILSRLYDKGTVVRSRAGRAYAYTPSVEDQAALAARRMHSELEKGDDRTGVLARFVSRLSPDDERVLRELLAQTEGGPGPGGTEGTGTQMARHDLLPRDAAALPHGDTPADPHGDPNVHDDPNVYSGIDPRTDAHGDPRTGPYGDPYGDPHEPRRAPA